jgi:ABC-type glycerol-3-phosphate transport system permease component
MSKSASLRLKKVLLYIGLLAGAVYTLPCAVDARSSQRYLCLSNACGPHPLHGCYIAVITDPEKVLANPNSYLVSTLVTLTLFMGILAGYSFSRYHFKFKRPIIAHHQRPGRAAHHAVDRTSVSSWCLSCLTPTPSC